MSEFLAHIKNSNGMWEKQLLSDHLNGVAKLSGEFAYEFGNKDWGELLGYWHDLGKYLPSWQSYLFRNSSYDTEAHIEDSGGRPNHSSAGAVLAYQNKKLNPLLMIAAYGIAGHHAGLPDVVEPSKGDSLLARILTSPFIPIPDLTEFNIIQAIEETQKFIGKPLPVSWPPGVEKSGEGNKQVEFIHLWIRMLYSCLVDADFLDTEKFMDSERFDERGGYHSLNTLKERFNIYISSKKSDLPINKLRNKILDCCREKAKLLPGFFSLTVPTGGGKTLSSMAFALEHAVFHNKKRIITAIPYTSIIEQTAKVFKYGSDLDDEIELRKLKGDVLFGEDQVIEHHSNIDPENETSANRLASENWDAPIIVTTNVQLFESLYAARSSSCRKLHNIVNSIIILDEVQMLPPEFLKPVLSILEGLVENYGVTVVLMTATQPSLTGKIGAGLQEFSGIKNVTEIIEDTETLSTEFKRVEINLPQDFSLRSEWSDVAEKILKYEQVLCIVNTRNDCRRLHALMPEGTIHLSAFMCGEERSYVISGIKEKLKKGEPVRVISTQLVEAGVDIDFPVVFRALAGLDSIAQAAGRCNRENKLAAQGKQGQVFVFIPPKSAPPGLLLKGENACKEVLRNNTITQLTPAIFKEYFRFFYPNINGFDKPGFSKQMVKEAHDLKFWFRTFANDFKLIDDNQRSIIIFYKNPITGKDSRKIINELKFKGPSRQLIRKLQRFVVNVPEYLFRQLEKNNYIEEVHGYYIQNDEVIYKEGLGLICNETDWISGDSVI